MTAGRIVIAGAQSGVGKTTIASAIMGALRRRGRDIRPFKAGPDYIDPSYHAIVCGRASRNLDSWMLTNAALLELFSRATAGDCLAVVEGVMGLFDGSSEPGAVSPRGSTASLAKLLGAPVVVVLDVRGAAQSAAAMALGYQKLDPELRVAGYILNRIGSEGHYRLCAESIQLATGLPTLGYFPRDDALALPERHLGLIPTGEHRIGPEFFERAIAQAEKTLDLEGVERVATEGLFTPVPSPAVQGNGPEGGMREDSRYRSLFPRSCAGDGDREPCPTARIALALDEAFGFYYEDNLDLLRAWGGEIVPFSPLADSALPACDGVYIGGGFDQSGQQATAHIACSTVVSNTITPLDGGLWKRTDRIAVPSGAPARRFFRYELRAIP